MRISIEKKNQSITFELLPFTQFCGANVLLKRFVIDSLEKHFSVAKYCEYEETMIDNVRVEGEKVGRKYFDCDIIRSREDLIKAVKLAKASLLHEEIVHILQNADYQKSMLEIEYNLDSIFNDINSELANRDICVQVDYRRSSLFDIVQRSYATTNDGRDIEFLTNNELVKSYLRLLCARGKARGDKQLLVFENIDHMLSRDDYERIVHAIEEMVQTVDLWIIITSSLPGYVFPTQKYLQGINCFNEIVYSVPEYEAVKEFVEYNYPVNLKFSDEDMVLLIAKSAPLIGDANLGKFGRELVIAKLINKTICVACDEDMLLSVPEIAFLQENRKGGG